VTNDHEIGRIVAVDTSQVTVELNRDLKALTRSTYEGTVEVGSINSYVIIPVGARRIVSMITRVVLTEESELKADKTMVALPASRRLMKATMIGTIDEKIFKQGINIFPVLDSPVLIATREDLDAIFGKQIKSKISDFEDPGYCIPIGHAAIFPDYDIKINPDAFFGKHAAIIGSTGSGKSCSIATILQSVIEHSQVKNTRFVILDTNGEYRSAFQRQKKDGTWSDAKSVYKSLYIPTDPTESERLSIPYWFMNSDDFVRLFRASPGVQRPVLLNALSSARNSSSEVTSWLQLRDDLIKECNRILGFCSGSDRSNAKAIRLLCDGLILYLNKEETADSITNLVKVYPDIDGDRLKAVFNTVRDIAREGIRNENQQYESYAVVDVGKRKRIENEIRPLCARLSRIPENYATLSMTTSDCPCYFGRSEFRYHYLEDAISCDEANSNRARDNCSTMLMRIYRLL